MVEPATRNILVIGPSWVGDMVMSQVLYKSLKEQHRNSHITVLATNWARPILERMPEVDDTMDLEIGHGELRLSDRRSLGKSLQELQFTQAIVLPLSFKSALIPFHANIGIRTGWRGEWRNLLLNDCRAPNDELFPLMVQRFAALAYAECAEPPKKIPKPRLVTHPKKVQDCLSKFNLQTESRILAICPGAEFGEAKQWPPEYYAELSNAMLAQGWQIWIFGSMNDELVTEAILADIGQSHAEKCHNLVGRTSMAEAIDLMSVASIAVSNDSGLMHVAAALDIPVVAIYGSTSPDFTPPFAERVKLLTTDIECRPCFKRKCPYGHLRCLTDLKAIEAIESVHSLLVHK
ncbi:MAG: lipopolysaccharide heptosyltransferase II [Gammaproteobacteria bacterium]|nr:lipopolysaccharide heptosyltransferase II [Gammaproteobacteria bacterium]|tara:strand:- start:12 stop:1055 length:1044 start_codon:yes stop_codon:yes gene_type:complete